MNEFIVLWDCTWLVYTCAIIASCFMGMLLINRLTFLRTMLCTLLLVGGGVFMYVYPEIPLKKEALKKLDSTWIEAIQKKEISDVPVSSIKVVGDFLIISMINDEMYFVPYEKISFNKRKVTPHFYKSISDFEESNKLIDAKR